MRPRSRSTTWTNAPVAAVATELACSVGAAKVLLHRGRRRLAEQIGGYSGRWVSETKWRNDAIVDHLRSTGSCAHVDVIVGEHLGDRGGRWELVLQDGQYSLNRDDGLRLDGGAFVLRSRHRLDLTPRSAPGAVVFHVSIDGNLLAASQVRNTTPPTS